jgi:RNA polymerase sigma-70 factor (ECF subfamily)
VGRYEPGEPTVPANPPASPDPVLSERRQLINLTYRLLGSLAEAEDAVQEAYARWYALPRPQRDAVASPGAWLTTVASRICLTLLGSARARRETYVGEWIPEPLPGPAGWLTSPPVRGPADPADRVTLDESVSMAFLVVLDSMTPAERVAFVLHDVFRYPFAEVAGIVGRTPAACRQLASSARHRIDATRAPAIPPAQQAGLVRAFKQAWEAQDIAALIGLLDPDATATADGGGRATTFRHPIHGAEQIARAWIELARRTPATMTFLERTVNGQPGLVAQHEGLTVSVFAFDIAAGRIRNIWVIRNPAKLRPWTAGPAGSAPGGGWFGSGVAQTAELAQQAEPELGTGDQRNDHEAKADQHQNDLPAGAAVAAEDAALVQEVASGVRFGAIADGSPADRQPSRRRG